MFMPWRLMGKQGIAVSIFHPALDSVVSFVLRPLYLWWKDGQYLWNMRLGGPQIWSEHFEEKRNLLLSGLEPRVLSCQVCSLATTLTELSCWRSSKILPSPSWIIMSCIIWGIVGKNQIIFCHTQKEKLQNSLLLLACLFMYLHEMMWNPLQRFLWCSYWGVLLNSLGFIKEGQ